MKVIKHKEYQCGDIIKAIFYTDNNKIQAEYYENYKGIHRDSDKPAVIEYYEDGTVAYEFYIKNGVQHREGGKPSEIYYLKKGIKAYECYYIEGKIYKVKEYIKGSFEWQDVYEECVYDIEFLAKYSEQMEKYMSREDKIKVFEYKMKQKTNV